MDYYLWECHEYDYYYKWLNIVYAYTSIFLLIVFMCVVACVAMFFFQCVD